MLARAKRIVGCSCGLLLAVLALAAVGLWARYGGGSTDFPDRNTKPLLPGSALELVAELPLPPGNVAVSASGRVYFSFHPEAGPDVKVAEWRDGRAVPWP